MKVISGKYKGRVLDGFDISGTRPTMDRVKESLFAMIQNYLDDAVVLDLFAGSGNLGIEALSEGAADVYFVDKNKKACKVIQGNLEKLGIVDAKTFCGDFQKVLKELALLGVKFDIIFLDPPYQTDFIEKSILSIVSLDILAENGILVAESDQLEKIIIPDNFFVVKNKKYGDKWVAILKHL